MLYGKLKSVRKLKKMSPCTKINNKNMSMNGSHSRIRLPKIKKFVSMSISNSLWMNSLTSYRLSLKRRKINSCKIKGYNFKQFTADRRFKIELIAKYIKARQQPHKYSNISNTQMLSFSKSMDNFTRKLGNNSQYFTRTTIMSNK